MIYLDSAATSFHRPESVATAVYEAINSLGNSSRGAHGAALAAARLVYETRELVAGLFHAPDADCVAFCANVTEALNIAIKGIFSPGDGVVTGSLEHNSVLRPLYEQEACGVKLFILSADAAGRPDYEAMEQLFAEEASIRAVVSTHASNLTGNLVDIGRIGQLCHRYGKLFILDTAQTAGVFPIDMQKQHIDIVCFTGHKALLGPQGTGGICVRPGLRLRTWKSGGSGIQTFSHMHPEAMPTHLEAGTLNAHGLAGLRAGLLYLQQMGIDSVRSEVLRLARQFYQGVQDISGVKVYGDFSTEYRAPIVSLNIRDEASGSVSDNLSTEYDICTRPGGHCAPLMHKHFCTVEQGMVRFSFSHFNTTKEIETAICAVRRLAEE
jgi:cysteine desulfurase family protein